jgi:transcriptional antiterminator RfaH
MAGWTVAQVETQRKHIARLLLMRQEYETYDPRIQVRGGKIVSLFPSYFFVRVIDRWYPILGTIGIIRLLMSGEQPAFLADIQLTNIRKREKDGFVILPKKPRFRVGDSVRIVAGNFQGKIAVYDGMSGRDRDRVLLDLLGRKVPVDLARGQVEPLPIEPQSAPALA